MDPNAQKSASASGSRKQPALRLPGFDTMKAVENLKEAEFREQQAVAIVETIREAQVDFATKDDLRTGLEKLELVLRSEIGSFRSEIRAEIQEQFATMYWRFLIGAGVIAGISGTIATFVVTLAGGNHS